MISLGKEFPVIAGIIRYVIINLIILPTLVSITIFFLHNRKLLMICAVKLEMFVRKSMSVYISPKLCPNNW